MDGFTMLKIKKEVREKIEDVDIEDYGGYEPAPLLVSDNMVTLDTFIRRSMGGKRVGLTIYWVINQATWVFDPWTGSLEQKP